MKNNDSKKYKSNRLKAKDHDGKIEASVHNILGGTFLKRDRELKWVPFILFLAFLAIIYISNIYMAERKKRKIEHYRHELKELRYEYISTKSELMFLSNQSQLVKKLNIKDLKESRISPRKLVTDNEINK